MRIQRASAAGLSACDREAIHTPGAIQAHGILFALTGHDRPIAAISATVEDHLGRPPASVVGRPFAELADERAGGDVAQEIARSDGAPRTIRPGHVLLVGEDPSTQAAVERYAADLGHAAMVAESPEQALQILDVGEAIDATLIDGTLPGTAGPVNAPQPFRRGSRPRTGCAGSLHSGERTLTAGGDVAKRDRCFREHAHAVQGRRSIVADFGTEMIDPGWRPDCAKRDRERSHLG